MRTREETPRRPHDARRDRWTAHRAQRRQEFVAAALRVLTTHGPELPMDAVAAEAGVTKPVLYRYFADKAALVGALGEYASALLQERLVPALTTDGPAMARIRDGVGAYFAIIDDNPDLYWLLARHGGADSSPGPGVVARQKEFIATTLTAVYGDYLRGFGLDSGAAEPWAFGITGLVQSTGEWWLDRRSMSRAHVIDYVSQLIWWALTGVLHEAGIAADPDAPVPPARPLLSLRTSGLAAGSRGPR
jgi:AcrR family transcriptional regulator